MRSRSLNHSVLCVWHDAYVFVDVEQHKRPAMVYLRHPSSTCTSSGKGVATADCKASADKGHIPRGLEYIPSGEEVGLPDRRTHGGANHWKRKTTTLLLETCTQYNSSILCR